MLLKKFNIAMDVMDLIVLFVMDIIAINVLKHNVHVIQL